ncbi:hypothetical protein RRG08_012571 [Elysia crispata]|uniref:Uncharacterized protein n=1 Tax=Elysia crispata TaxID=231223 RepID=A0AAE1AP99_9GAST|nr:hypothetical protein RRG08_012571 [Elysia crispata]
MSSLCSFIRDNKLAYLGDHYSSPREAIGCTQLPSASSKTATPAIHIAGPRIQFLLVKSTDRQPQTYLSGFKVNIGES